MNDLYRLCRTERWSELLNRVEQLDDVDRDRGASERTLLMSAICGLSLDFPLLRRIIEKGADLNARDVSYRFMESANRRLTRTP